MKKRRLKKAVKNIILLVLIIIFIFSSIIIINFYKDSHKNKKINKKLIDEVVNIEIKQEDNKEEEVIKIDFDKLLAINSDTIGWIILNQNNINNPIVHTSDNSYYLNKAFDKTRNQAGTIFMDYRNISFDDRNVVLFGHSMKDGTMFGSLSDLFKDGYFDKKENNYIQIINQNNELLTYQIFSYYVTEKEELYITTSFNNDNEFYKFIDTITRRTYKKFDVDVGINDKILTLSTCAGSSGTTKRRVVHAKRIENIE